MKKLLSITFLFAVFLISLESINLASAIKDDDLDEKRSSAGIDFNNVSALAYSKDSNPYNISFADWTANWWKWAYSIASDKHPSYDDTGKFCGENQKIPVWFLSNSFEHPVIRTCEIPSDTSILVALLNSECSYAEFPTLNTEKGLRDCAKKMQDIVGKGHTVLNGTNISNMIEYNLQTTLFNFTFTRDNILNLASQTTRAVADGNWLFLKPLPPGTHELVIKGDINSTKLKNMDTSDTDQYSGPIGWNQTTTYILKVK